MMNTTFTLPWDAEKLHRRLSEDSRARREALWRKAGGAPWQRMRNTQGTPLNALRRRKLDLLEQLDVRRRKLALMEKA